MSLACISLALAFLFLGRSEEEERPWNDPTEASSPKATAPSKGMALIHRTQNSPSAQIPFKDLLTTQSRSSLLPTFRRMMRLSDASARRQELEPLVDQFLDMDEAEVIDLIVEAWEDESLRGGLHFFVPALGAGLAGKNMNQAFRTYEALSEPLRSEFAEGMVIEWAGRDPAQALKWVLDLEASSGRFELVRQISGTVHKQGRTDHVEAWAKVLSEEPVNMDHTRLLMNLWPKTQPQAAMDWIGTIQDQGIQRVAYEGMASAMVRRDVEEAARWVARFPLEHGVRDRAVDLVSATWAQSNPDAAQTWAQEMGRTVPFSHPEVNRAYIPGQMILRPVGDP